MNLIILDEINKCVEHKLYLAGLTLSLTLIDSCAKVEYPNERKNNVRYKNWYKRFILSELISSEEFDGFSIPVPSEDEIYSLRNNMLHESNLKIENPTFELYISEGYLDFTKMSVGTITGGITNWKHDIKINVRHLIKIIVKYTKSYYLENEDDFPPMSYILK